MEAPESMVAHLCDEIRERRWFYRHRLPDGTTTESYLPPDVLPIHESRLHMLVEHLEERYGRDWSALRCLDLGCHEGFFSMELARRGCSRVLGIDARRQNLEHAELIRRAYRLDNVELRQGDLRELSARELGRFDVVLLFGVLYHVDDPIGVLRTARDLTAGVCVIETQIGPELEGALEWGSATYAMPIRGALAIVDEAVEIEHGNREAGVSGMALVPSLGGLLTLLRAVGLEEAQVLEPPPGAYEQLARGRRVMISARSTPRSDRRPMCPSVGERPRPIDVLERLASPSGLCRWSVARSRAELEAARANAWVRAQVGLQEVVIPRGTAPGELFDLPGICPVELRAVRFRVDLESSSDGRKEAPLPNYRERMVCPSCGLNARQRALALVARSFAGTVPAGSPVLLLEQESALFRFLADLPDIGTRLVGSELLGPSYQSGEVVDGIRNEDACRLSFASASLAVHMSGDVLEHVNDPRRALAEAHRCLEPGGLLLFTVPFHHDRDRSRARATIDMQGRLRHLAPPVFHGDPMRPEGALVITDFGWDLLEWIRDAGFRDAAALAYWDPSFGFLHPLDFLFVGWK